MESRTTSKTLGFCYSVDGVGWEQKMEEVYDSSVSYSCKKARFQQKGLGSFRFVNCKGVNELIYEIKGKVNSKFLIEVRALDGFYFVNHS
ncbi:hypothetical protein DKX38_012393 [Salix brachista]|uniref:Uncharacterized protein n=1 Tax=Salix brachista TaxID=2182728 RepID=A0A5N5LQB9_9ROSI|nr:hypothetical protein DKX38_012393 [Salix brachista]